MRPVRPINSLGVFTGRKMTEELIYWGMFVIASFLVFLIVLVIVVVFELIFNYDSSDPSNIAITFLFAGIVVFIGPGSFYALSYFFDAHPPSLQMINNQPITEFDGIKSLNEKADALQQLLEHPKELTLSQLSSIAEDAIILTKQIRTQSENQNLIIANLRAEVEQESKKATEAQKLAKEIQSITRDQLNAVKLLITEDAKVQASNSFYMGLLFSFPLGVLASLTASFAYRRFRGTIKADAAKVKKHIT